MVTRFKGTKRPFLGERLEGATPPPKPKRRTRAAKAKAKAKGKVTPKRVNTRYKIAGTGLTVWNGPGGPQICHRGYEPWKWPKVKRDPVTGYGRIDL